MHLVVKYHKLFEQETQWREYTIVQARKMHYDSLSLKQLMNQVLDVLMQHNLCLGG